MDDWKQVVGALLGASIAVVWIVYALLFSWSILVLAIAISLTIFFGTVSGGLYAMSSGKYGWKETVGGLLGASIAIVWIDFALIWPGNMLVLVIAISVTILFGTLSGGLYALSKKD